MTTPAHQPAPASTEANTKSNKAAGKDGNEKTTYNINVKELNKLEATMTENERPLKHHWANFSFYFMASLSIILPLLFLCKSSSSEIE
jgi:hypothetical protein